MRAEAPGAGRPLDAQLAMTDTAAVNGTLLLFVIVGMTAITKSARCQLTGDADAAIRQLYAHHAEALHVYVERFCPDRASADDIVQETFIRAWRHLPQLSADDRPIRPWLFRVARNLLTDADRAARARPMTVQAQPAEDAGRRLGAGPGPGPANSFPPPSSTCRPRTAPC